MMLAKMSLNQKKRLNLKSDYDIRPLSPWLKGYKYPFHFLGSALKICIHQIISYHNTSTHLNSRYCSFSFFAAYYSLMTGNPKSCIRRVNNFNKKEKSLV